MQTEELNEPIILEYNEPQQEILESTAQRNLFHSGVGIGKSECIGTLSAEFLINDPEVRGFIGANTYSQLTKSTLDRVFGVWEKKFKWVKGVHYVVDHIPPKEFKIIGPPLKTYENTISFNNGGLIMLASLDNYKVIDGTEFGWAMLDETKDTREEAVKEVIVARLRQIGMLMSADGIMYKTPNALKKVESGLWTRNDDGTFLTDKGVKVTGYNPLFIFTSPAKASWLMKWFELDKDADNIERVIYDKDNYYRKRTGDRLVVIASTYHNAKNLSPGYIPRLIEDIGNNENLIKMLIYGSPFGKTGGEFYSKYTRLKHVKDWDGIWEDEPIHLSFDFNLVPYITCTCWQMKMINGRWLVRCFDEFCLPNPDNNSESLCDKIIEKYDNLLKNGLFIYGDYSGKTDTTVSKDVRNNFDMIELKLAAYLSNYSNRVTKNGLHHRRRDFMNNIFGGHPRIPIDIEIHTRCVETIADYEFVKENNDGKKLKYKVTVNNRTYEEHGHTSDSGDYFFCSAFENYFDL